MLRYYTAQANTTTVGIQENYKTVETLEC